jgi:hypothetical protein
MKAGDNSVAGKWQGYRQATGIDGLMPEVVTLQLLTQH